MFLCVCGFMCVCVCVHTHTDIEIYKICHISTYVCVYVYEWATEIIYLRVYDAF